MMRLSSHARVFLAGLIALALLVTAGWMAWYYYAHPRHHFDVGLSMRVPRAWQTVDVSMISAEVRPVVSYVNPKHSADRLTIMPRRTTGTTLDGLATIVGTDMKHQDGNAVVDQKMYLDGNHQRPFVLVHGAKGTELAAVMLVIDHKEYLVEATFPTSQERSFGRAAVAVMKGIHLP